MKFTVKNIAINATIAALYVALTLLTFPVSFLGIQFRIAEILILLCFFDKRYILGCTLGCIIANAFSSIGLLDMLFGGAATLLSCLAISFSKHLAISLLFPIGLNALIVGYELYLFLEEPFFISVGFVALGELVVMIVGYVIIRVLKNNKAFFKMIEAQQNIDFKW